MKQDVWFPLEEKSRGLACAAVYKGDASAIYKNLIKEPLTVQNTKTSEWSKNTFWNVIMTKPNTEKPEKSYTQNKEFKQDSSGVKDDGANMPDYGWGGGNDDYLLVYE